MKVVPPSDSLFKNFLNCFCAFLFFFVLFVVKIWLKGPRTILPFGKDLAAREETAAVRGKHFENGFPLRRTPFKNFLRSFYFSILEVFAFSTKPSFIVKSSSPKFTVTRTPFANCVCWTVLFFERMRKSVISCQPVISETGCAIG